MSRTRAPRATHLTLVAPGEAGSVPRARPAGEISDLAEFKQRFPARWQGFLKAHFGSYLHVQFFFQVDERTARFWWEGVSAPRAHVLAVALAEIPSAAAWLLPRAA